MNDGWPSRPFHQLPPPEGGAAAVRRAAGRRRARTAALTSAATALVLLGGVTLALPSRSRGADTLRVADDPTSRPSPASSGSASPSASPTAGTTTPGPVASGPPAPGSSSATPGVPPPHTSAGGAGGSDYRTPDLTRTYIDRPSTTGLGVCQSTSDSGTTGLQSTVHWCLAAGTTHSLAGRDLVSQVCRDSSGDAQLSFASAQEVELLVQDSAGRTVWTWSTGHADPTDPHALQVQQQHCWDWTASWTDVDARGRPLAAGSYILIVRSRAQELRAAPDATASFTV